MKHIILFLISTLDYIENLFRIHITNNSIVERIDIVDKLQLTGKHDTLPSNDLNSIFITRPHKIYELKLCDGSKIYLSDEHKIHTKAGYIELQKLETGSIVTTRHGRSFVVSIKQQMMKRMMIDFDVQFRNYYANGLLVHNCVRSDTEVKVKINDKEIDIPIYRLHYKYKKYFTIFDFIEFNILKILHFLYRINK